MVVETGHDLGCGLSKKSDVSIGAFPLAHMLVQTLAIAMYLSPIGARE